MERYILGVTTDLIKRVYEHKNKLAEGFTKKYNVSTLVYYEVHDEIERAIEREKKLKKYKREYKLNLINAMNPEWADLYERLV